MELLKNNETYSRIEAYSRCYVHFYHTLQVHLLNLHS
jgi:hypothetical protein